MELSHESVSTKDSFNTERFKQFGALDLSAAKFPAAHTMNDIILLCLQCLS